MFSIHHIPFLLCFWYIGSYILQPYPANIIAICVIAVITGISCRSPKHGAILAVFLTPLTLSLGRHLEVYLAENAPVYLPYAETILISTLWGWVWRSILNRMYVDTFSIDEHEKTDLEKLTLFTFGLWGLSALLGVFPALYRNLMTSSILPVDVILMKIAFAPVWGLADEFFPITVAVRTLLLFFFVFYAQKLLAHQNLSSTVASAFMASMLIVAGYAIFQFFTEFGYSKNGNPSRYVQSTFHENEGLATFCLCAFSMLLFYILQTKNWMYRYFFFVISLFLLMTIVLSNSRAIMLITIVFYFCVLIWYCYKGLLWHGKRWKVFASYLGLFVILMLLLPTISPTIWKKINRLYMDYELMNEASSKPTAYTAEDRQEASKKEGSLTLAVRVKFWKSAITMLQDSWFSGMGTGSYYRLTGFPRYQSMYKMENAHMFWLQFWAELGFSAIVVTFFFNFMLFQIKEVFWQVSLTLFSICNFIGQSLLQHEITWFIAIIVSVAFVGPTIQFSKQYKTSFSMTGLLLAFFILLLPQSAIWAWKSTEVSELGWMNNKSETYGYGFDELGHRYLKIGSVYRERVYIPAEGCTLEFRINNNTNSDVISVQTMMIDSFNHIIVSDEKDFGKIDGIQSLELKLTNNIEKETWYDVILISETVERQGSLLKSNEREMIGFHYYGYRISEKSLLDSENER